MAQEQKYQKLAEALLRAVGGVENVTDINHCMTRLRFNLKDESIPKEEEIKKISGVLGIVKAGGQFQIIVGQTVDKVYDSICSISGFRATERVDENLDAPTRKMTLKSIGNTILDRLAGSLTPLIPVLVAASMFKLFATLFGPSMLGWASQDSDIIKLFTFVGDSGFYFFPILVGFTSAKKFNSTPVLGAFLGAILVHPTLIDMAAQGTAFTVYGIPAAVQNYSSTLLPIFLSVWIMSYVERFFKKILPASLKTIFAPTFTTLVMLPLALCVLGPAGGFAGTYFGKGLLAFSDFGGLTSIIVIVIIGALWEFLVMTGMHFVLITTLIMMFTSTGQEGLVFPGAIAASMAVSGMCLGMALRLKNKEERGLAAGYLVAALIGGVTEPALYGLGLRYRKPFLGMMIGGAAGALYAAIFGVKAYTLVPVASFLTLTSYAGGATLNFVNGIISGAIAFVVAAIATYFLGVKPEDPEAAKN